MILAIDTSTAACTVALFAADGVCVASQGEQIGRGHSERLVPMIAEVVGTHRPATILAGVGPGSFTGIRVGIAAAHGLAIGWGAEVHGLSSLALLAASAGVDGPVAAVVDGGHGELFVQMFDGATLDPLSALLNAPPEEAAAAVTGDRAVGPGAERLIAALGRGTAIPAWPSAANALRLPAELRTLPPKPLYARAPDAKAKAA